MCELRVAQFPDPFQTITNSDIEEAGDENTMALDEDSDVDIEL